MLSSPSRLIREGNKVGFPLIVKAARGGGESPLFIVNDLKQTEEAILHASLFTIILWKKIRILQDCPKNSKILANDFFGESFYCI